MKIRTDFVTNSSSSSFTVRLRAKFADGVMVKIGSEEWSGDGDSQSVSFFAEAADGTRLCSAYCGSEESEIMEMLYSLSVETISLTGIIEKKNASSLADAMKRPFGLNARMEIEMDEEFEDEEFEDEEYEDEEFAEDAEELAQQFNAVADACDAALAEHLKRPADLKALSLFMEFGGRGEFLAGPDEIIGKLFDGWQGRALEEALNGGADVAALRKLPFLAQYTDRALQNMIDFWNECDYAPGHCEVKQRLTGDGMVDMTITWGEELFKFDDDDTDPFLTEEAGNWSNASAGEETDKGASELVSTEKQTLAGLKFVVTGDIRAYPDREKFKQFIISHGGRLVGSVSSKTNYLITNDPDSGTVKNRKAKELGIKVISEDEFFDMLRQ